MQAMQGQETRQEIYGGDGMSKITVCPKCDSAEISPRSGKGGSFNQSGEIKKAYYCDACNARFDDPVIQEPKTEQMKAEDVLKRIGVDPSEAMQ